MLKGYESCLIKNSKTNIQNKQNTFGIRITAETFLHPKITLTKQSMRCFLYYFYYPELFRNWPEAGFDFMVNVHPEKTLLINQPCHFQNEEPNFKFGSHIS